MLDAMTTSVPVYNLYGEQHPWMTPEPLHIEWIHDRSSDYDWHIPPHRHAGLMHYTYIRRGAAELHLEGVTYPVTGPAILIVPAMAIHGFDLDPDIEGYSMAMIKPMVDDLSTRLGQWGETLMRGGAYPLAGQGEAEAIDTLFSQLHTEYCRQEIGRDASLQAIALALTVQIVRRIQRADTHGLRDNKGYQYLVRFEALVECRFREQPSIEALASDLGISGTYLNILCQRHSGTRALQILNGRLMLEAKRLLVYSTMTISQVADDLGFSDPAYFTRAFKRSTGITPKAFRLLKT